MRDDKPCRSRLTEKEHGHDPPGLCSCMANRLPFEIWLHIKGFLDPTESEWLYSINSAWFQMVMDDRYRVLDLTLIDSRVLARLPVLRDPDISKRVRHLCISVAALERAEVRLIMEIIPTLSNVSECSVVWNFRGTQEAAAHALEATILPAVWATCGATLKKLDISAQASRLNKVLASNVYFSQLETFSLELLRQSESESIVAEAASLFFPRVNPRLTTLSIHCRRALDPSSVLNQLQLFSRLQSLTLVSYPSELKDPSGLETFFAHCASHLCHLKLSLSHSALSSKERGINTLHMANAHIPLLETLEIAFGCPDTRDTLSLIPSELHSLFDGARTTLHRLVLEEIALNLEDLRALTSVLVGCDGLRSLTVSVAEFTAAHIDIIARNSHMISALGVVYVFTAQEKHQFEADLSLQSSTYNHWKLREISIWRWKRTVDHSRWDLVQPFATCIPTIETFFGMPVPRPGQSSRNSIVPRMLEALELVG
ncbi:hypothetical protein FB45DRAFT_358902 [Roridomyces roridus]|uniref:F-box domain-containing protein n=1 Tax=Roridomyces roridus TaxID=1738132 RepID=A0AAD7C7N5_9AGAR|nr:hypothetical protein FB45DRAFT_358902 [Roridomyces roridus]